MRRKNTLIIALTATGASGIIAQILLLRELLVVFYGNELTLGIILSNWLAIESLGSFLTGRYAEKHGSKIPAFIYLIIASSLALPASIYIARISKEVLGGNPFESADIIRVLYSSALSLLPTGLCHGALFALGCKIHALVFQGASDNFRIKASSIGKVYIYIYETIGTIIGGCFAGLVLTPNFDSFHIAFGTGAFTLAVCLTLSWQVRKDYHPVFKISIIFSAWLCALYIFILTSNLSDNINSQSLRGLFPGQDIVYSKNSVYGNISVARRKGQYTFYYDGTSFITTPNSDINTAEEFAHLPMLSHPDPFDILVIGKGAGGFLHEILKYKISKLAYVEIDPLVITVLKKFSTPLTEGELLDPRVNVINTDGRAFITKTCFKYDIVFIGFDTPSSLSINRLFTKEFFGLLKNRLKKNGIVAFRLPGSMTYIPVEANNLNTCVLNSLRAVFPYTKTVPGDETIMHMASPDKEFSARKGNDLAKRLKDKDINTKLISPSYIKYKLDPHRAKWFEDNLCAATKRQNLDFTPVGVYFNLSYWNAMAAPRAKKLLRVLTGITPGFFQLIFVALGALLTGVLLLSGKPLDICVPVCIAGTGFSGMLFNLMAIFSFQIIYGYVYHWVGLLVSVFYAGVLSGGIWGTKNLGRIENDLTLFLKTDLFIAGFALVLPAVLGGCKYACAKTGAVFYYKIVFIIIYALSGMITGAQFPLANKIALGQK